MSTTTVEFHWAGTDGTCRNLSKFGLIADKVVFTFNYDTIAYVQGLMKSFTLNGSILELTAPQEQELIAFSIANSRVDPFVTEAGEYAAQAKESARRAAESQMFAALSQDHADQSAITAVTSAATSQWSYSKVTSAR